MGKLSLRILENNARLYAHRSELPDFLRGADMLLVLLYHAGFPFGSVITAFFMPLFFVFTGYMEYKTNKCSKTEFRSYVKNKFIRLMIPYFCFEFVIYLLYSLYQSVSAGAAVSPAKALYSILTCINTEAYTGFYGRMWFLPCMFVSSIMTWLIIRAVIKIKEEADVPLLGCFAVIMFFLSWVTTHVIRVRLPMTIDTACFGTAFLLSGYVFGGGIDYLLKKDHVLFDVLLSISALLILLGTILSGRGEVQMNINRYGEYLDSIVGAFCGILVFFIVGKWSYEFLVTKKLELIKSIALWYGRNSLTTFPVHMLILKGMTLLKINKYILKFH